MGLLSPGGVHSHQDHFLACALALNEAGVKVNIHAFLDGRDVPPKSAATYIHTFESAITHHPDIAIQTICGRYYPMDRDQRWERIEKAFHAIVHGKSECEFMDPIEALQAAYDEGVTDEFFAPSCRSGYPGMHPKDGILMINFRADRSIQLLKSLSDPSFASFERNGFQHTGPARGMTAYNQDLQKHFIPLFVSEAIDDRT
jgi:2,3-bisphosphoglycerate-independent phosphoglycerate mutase